METYLIKSQFKTQNYVFVVNSDSPHSVQTLYDCTIYETAQNPSGLSLLPLPVKAEHKSTD